MTDLYRIKELEWDREGRGDCIAQSPLGEIRLHQYFDIYGCIAWEYQGNRNLTLREAKAAANDHHRKEVEKMLSPVESGWISVEESLPETGQYVLWYTACGNQYIECIDKDDWGVGRETTQWQPLTPAPGGEI